IREDGRNAFHDPFRRGPDGGDMGRRGDADAGGYVRRLVQHRAEAVIGLRGADQHRDVVPDFDGEIGDGNWRQGKPFGPDPVHHVFAGDGGRRAGLQYLAIAITVNAHPKAHDFSLRRFFGQRSDAGDGPFSINIIHRFRRFVAKLGYRHDHTGPTARAKLIGAAFFSITARWRLAMTWSTATSALMNLGLAAKAASHNFLKCGSLAASGRRGMTCLRNNRSSAAWGSKPAGGAS